MSYSSDHQFQPSTSLTPGIKWFFIVNIGIFFLAQVPALMPYLDLLYFKTDQFWPYQWVTYAFFHTDAMHLIFNMVCLFFAGITVEQHLKTREFLYFYFACAIGGALLGYVVSFFGPTFNVLGASGAVYGIFYALYRIHPEAQVLAFFVFPIKLKYFLLLFGLVALAMTFSNKDGVAHFAHLGGLLTAIAWFRYSDSVIFLYNGWKTKREEQEVVHHEEVKKTVDELLEKISKEGMGALTKKERQFLNKASNRFKD